MSKIRIGVPEHLAARPLISGLAQNSDDSIVLVYDEPGSLALSLERREIDAALIPSIEFLRGVGQFSVPGSALVANGPTKNLLLISNKPLEQVRRVAVDEFSRTPLVALRVVLDKLYGILPDLCVLKRKPQASCDWCEDFDAVLLTGDEGLRYCSREMTPSEICHDIGEMWRALYSKPLVLSLWAYNDEGLGKQLEAILNASRDYGVKNISRLFDTPSESLPYDGEFLSRYYDSGFGFHLGVDEEEGLRLLQDTAFDYELLQHKRLDRVLVG